MVMNTNEFNYVNLKTFKTILVESVDICHFV